MTNPAPASLILKLHSHPEDNGNCRVYYKTASRNLYCWQLEGPQQFKFYRCSRDGEPSHEVKFPNSLPFPAGETSIGRELIDYLNKNGFVNTTS